MNETHTYCKLEPSNINNEELLQEGEGVLGDENVGEKKHKGDFALWKKSKEGEPSWNSPWGQGRPGWHIECSAMCSSMLPCPIDIHSGGNNIYFLKRS